MRKFDPLKKVKMIKHALKDNQLHISIEGKDFSYRIPLNKIEDSINWKVGNDKSNVITINNVSKWTMKFFTNNFTIINHVRSFKGIVA